MWCATDCKGDTKIGAIAHRVFTEGSCRPPIREKNIKVRHEAIRQIVKKAEQKIQAGEVVAGCGFSRWSAVGRAWPSTGVAVGLRQR